MMKNKKKNCTDWLLFEHDLSSVDKNPYSNNKKNACSFEYTTNIRITDKTTKKRIIILITSNKANTNLATKFTNRIKPSFTVYNLTIQSSNQAHR